MIASDRKALRVGSAKLVVDGTDETVCRKAEISLSPGRVKARALSQLVALSVETYNAALEHRRGAWARAGVSVSRFDQFNEIPDVRRCRPDVVRFGNGPIRGAISRVDEAFSAFFARRAASETPGYPRFKSRRRLRTVFYDEPVNWALRGLGGPHPGLYVKGVGEIALTGNAARQLWRLLERGGEPRILTITRTASGSWRATVGFRGVKAEPLSASDPVGGVDRGVTVTAALPDGTLLVMPKFLGEAREAIADIGRQRARLPERSVEWTRCNRALAKVHATARRRTENWARHCARDIVLRYGVIVLEDLNLTAMTRSARGTPERPGKGVAAKKGLNRSLQEAALGRLAYWICVRAEEAGRRVWKVNPKNTSRECAACGHTESANRHQSHFACRRCGHTEHADVNAAQVLSARGQAADAAWVASGRPLLSRPVPRNRRRKEGVIAVRAGSARHAAVA